VAQPQSLSSLKDFEPLVPETRLAAIEARIRREHPRLPENAVFLAYREPPQTIETERDGLVVPVHIAAIACFAIFIPHPKYPERPGYGYLPIGRMVYDQRDGDRMQPPVKAWRTLDWEHRHSSDLDSDPAFISFKLGPVKEALAWYESVKDLIVKKPEVASGT
jgi:hypothetical protein